MTDALLCGCSIFLIMRPLSKLQATHTHHPFFHAFFTHTEVSFVHLPPHPRPRLSPWTTSSSGWPKRRKEPPSKRTPPPTSRPLANTPDAVPHLCSSQRSTFSTNFNFHRAAHTNALITPLNVLLLLLLGYTLYSNLRSQPLPTLPKEPPATVFRTFTPRTLLPFDGQGGRRIYFAVRGRVFDVTYGRQFYGPGGPYENFAGRDASRGLACGSFDEDMLTKDLDGPLDKLDDLGPDEWAAMRDWEDQFESKYLVVGRLVPVGEEDEDDKEEETKQG